jgi:hypothetical protein
VKSEYEAIETEELRASWLSNKVAAFKAIRVVSFVFLMTCIPSNKAYVAWQTMYGISRRPQRKTVRRSFSDAKSALQRVSVQNTVIYLNSDSF